MPNMSPLAGLYQTPQLPQAPVGSDPRLLALMSNLRTPNGMTPLGAPSPAALDQALRLIDQQQAAPQGGAPAAPQGGLPAAPGQSFSRNSLMQGGGGSSSNPFMQGWEDAERSTAAGNAALAARINQTMGQKADYTEAMRAGQGDPNAPHYGLASLLQHPLDTIGYGAGQMASMLKGQGMGAAAGAALGGAATGLLLKNPMLGLKAGAQLGAFLQPAAAGAGNTVLAQEADPAQRNKPLADKNAAALTSGAIQGGMHYLIPEGAIAAAAPKKAAGEVIDALAGKEAASAAAGARGPVSNALQALIQGAGQGALYTGAGTFADQAIQSQLAGQNRVNLGDVADSAVLGATGAIPLHLPAAGVNAMKGIALKANDTVRGAAGKAGDVIDSLSGMDGKDGKDGTGAQGGPNDPNAPSGGSPSMATKAGAALVKGLGAFRGPLAATVGAAKDFAGGVVGTAANEWVSPMVDRVVEKAANTQVGERGNLKDYLSDVGQSIAGSDSIVRATYDKARGMWRKASEDPTSAVLGVLADSADVLHTQLSKVPLAEGMDYLKGFIGSGAGPAYEAGKQAVAQWAAGARDATTDAVFGGSMRDNMGRMQPDSPTYDADYHARMAGSANTPGVDAAYPPLTRLSTMLTGDGAASIFDKARSGTAAPSGDLHRFVMAMGAKLSGAGKEDAAAWSDKFATPLREAMQDRYGAGLGAVVTAGVMGEARRIAGLYTTADKAENPAVVTDAVKAALSNVTDAMSAADAAYERAHTAAKAKAMDEARGAKAGAGTGDIPPAEKDVTPEQAAAAESANQNDNAGVFDDLMAGGGNGPAAEPGAGKQPEAAPAQQASAAEPVTDKQLDAVTELTGIDAHAAHALSRHNGPVDIPKNATPEQAAAIAGHHHDAMLETASQVAGRPVASAEEARAILHEAHAAADKAAKAQEHVAGGQAAPEVNPYDPAARVAKVKGAKTEPDELLASVLKDEAAEAKTAGKTKKTVDPSKLASFGTDGMADTSNGTRSRNSLVRFGAENADRIYRDYVRPDAPLNKHGTAKLLSLVTGWLTGDSKLAHIPAEKVHDALQAQFGHNTDRVWAELEAEFRHQAEQAEQAGADQAGEAVNHLSGAEGTKQERDAGDLLEGNKGGARTFGRQTRYGKDGLPMSFNEAGEALKDLGISGTRMDKPLTADVSTKTKSDVALEDATPQNAYITTALRALKEEYPGGGAGFANRAKATVEKMRAKVISRMEKAGASEAEIDAALDKAGLGEGTSHEEALGRHYVVVHGDEDMAGGGLTARQWASVKAAGKGKEEGQGNITVHLASPAGNDSTHKLTVSPVKLTAEFAKKSGDYTKEGLLSAFHEAIASVLVDPRVKQEQPFSSSVKNSGVHMVDGQLHIDPNLVVYHKDGVDVRYKDLLPADKAGRADAAQRLRAGVEALRAAKARGEVPSVAAVSERINRATKEYNIGSSLASLKDATGLDALKSTGRLSGDIRVAERANKIIAMGLHGDSLANRYAEAVRNATPGGDVVNSRKAYSPEDSVYVHPDFGQDIHKDGDLRAQVRRAIDAGAVIVTSPANTRVREGHQSELQLARYLTDNGYADVGGGRWVKVAGDAKAITEGVEARTRLISDQEAKGAMEAAKQLGITREQVDAARRKDFSWLNSASESQRGELRAAAERAAAAVNTESAGRRSFHESEVGGRSADDAYENSDGRSNQGLREGETDYINRGLDEQSGVAGSRNDEPPRHYDETTGEVLGAYSRKSVDERQEWASSTVGKLLRMADIPRGEAMLKAINEADKDGNVAPGDILRRTADLERALAGKDGARATQLRDALRGYQERLVSDAQAEARKAWDGAYSNMQELGYDHSSARALATAMFKALRQDRMEGNSRYPETNRFLAYLSKGHPEAYEYFSNPRMFQYMRDAEPKGTPKWTPQDASEELGAQHLPGADRQLQSHLGNMEGDSPKKAGGVRYNKAADAFLVDEKRVADDPVKAARYISERTGARVEILKDLPYAGESDGDVVRLAHDAPASTAAHELMHHFLSQIVEDPRGAEVVRMLRRVADSKDVQRQMREQLDKLPTAMRDQVLAQMDGERGQHERIAYMYQMHTLGLIDVKEPQARGWIEKFQHLLRRVFKITSEHDLASKAMDYLHDGRYSVTSDPSPIAKLHRDVMKTRAPEYVQKVQGAYHSFSQALERIQAPAAELLHESGIRDLGRISDLFKPKAGAETTDPGFITAHRAVTTQWLNRWANITDTLDEYQRDVLHKYAQQMDRDGKASFTPDAQVKAAYGEMRKLLNEVAAHVDEAGVQRVVLGEHGEPELANMGRRPNYFPSVFDPTTVAEKREQFMKLLQHKGFSAADANDTYGKVVNGGHASPDTFGLGYNPFFGALGERKLNLTAKEAEPFLSRNMDKVMANYLSQAAKRSEYVRRFGNGGEKIRQAMDEAKALGADKKQMALYRDAIMKLEGTAHKDVDPRWAKAMGPLLAAVNVAVLPASLLTNLNDAIDIGVRSNSAAKAFGAFSYGIRNLYRNLRDNGENPTELDKLAEEFGTMTRKRLEETVSGYNEQPDGIGRKINNLFFRANGVDPWTRAMHAYGTDTALNFIDHHLKQYDSSATSKRFMDQLGLKPGDVQRGEDGKLVRDGKNTKLRNAVNVWSHQAVLKPSEADTPVWFGDPRFAVFSHLKQFGYAFDQNVRHWALHEMHEGNYKPLAMMATHVPGMMATMYLRALAMHGGVLPAPMNSWGLTDWIGESMFRTGMWGERFGQVADLEHPAFLAGPTATLATQGLRHVYDSWTK